METNHTSHFLVLRELVARECCCDETLVTQDASLEDFGLDSLDFVNLMLCVSNEIGPIPSSKYAEIVTIGDILKALPC